MGSTGISIVGTALGAPETAHVLQTGGIPLLTVAFLPWSQDVHPIMPPSYGAPAGGGQTPAPGTAPRRPLLAFYWQTRTQSPEGL